MLVSAFAGRRIDESIRVSFWIFTFLPFAVFPPRRALRPEGAEKNGLVGGLGGWIKSCAG